MGFLRLAESLHATIFSTELVWSSQTAYMDNKIQKITNSSIQAAHLRGHRNSSMFGFLRIISKHLFSKEGVFVFCFFIKAFKTISYIQTPLGCTVLYLLLL